LINANGKTFNQVISCFTESKKATAVGDGNVVWALPELFFATKPQRHEEKRKLRFSYFFVEKILCAFVLFVANFFFVLTYWN